MDQAQLMQFLQQYMAQGGQQAPAVVPPAGGPARAIAMGMPGVNQYQGAGQPAWMQNRQPAYGEPGWRPQFRQERGPDGVMRDVGMPTNKPVDTTGMAPGTILPGQETYGAPGGQQWTRQQDGSVVAGGPMRTSYTAKDPQGNTNYFGSQEAMQAWQQKWGQQPSPQAQQSQTASQAAGAGQPQVQQQAGAQPAQTGQMAPMTGGPLGDVAWKPTGQKPAAQRPSGVPGTAATGFAPTAYQPQQNRTMNSFLNGYRPQGS